MVTAFIQAHWHSTVMVVRGESVDMTAVEGVCAYNDGKLVGLATYRIDDTTAELLSFDSLCEGQGIGSAMLDRVKGAARSAGCGRLILITTNDNIHALRYYQRQGFDITNLYRNAMDAVRKIKPEVPLIGNDGIPLRHKIELELSL